MLNLFGGEVVENLAAYFTHVAGCDLLHLLVACGEQVTDADAAVFCTEGAADVSVLLQACHDAGETCRQGVGGNCQFGHGQGIVLGLGEHREHHVFNEANAGFGLQLVFQLAGEVENDGADKEPAFSLLGGEPLDGIAVCGIVRPLRRRGWCGHGIGSSFIGYGAPLLRGVAVCWHPL